MDIDTARREIRSIFLGNPSLEDAAPGVAVIIRRLLDSDGASVTVVDGDDAHYVGAVGSAASLLGERRPLLDSFTGDVVLTRQARVFEPHKERLSSHGRAAVSEFRSGLVVPVVLRDRTLGTLGVTSRRSAAYGQDDLQKLSSVADLIVETLGWVEESGI